MRNLIASMLGLALLVAAPAAAHAASGVTLRGSHDSMVRQHRIARENDFSFLRTPAQVREWVKAGRLVPIRGNEDYAVAGASFAVTRPQTLTLVERLAAQYHDACGEKLYVTSATRPEDLQPWNASPLSVHPAGMAVDLRVSSSAACRSWIEQVLLSLESKGVLDVTREHHPPHYHVSLYPRQYASYLTGRGAGVQIAKNTGHSRGTVTRAVNSKRYRVGRGDNLWTIARRHNTSVASLKRANGINSSRLKPGQLLEIPARSR